MDEYYSMANNSCNLDNNQTMRTHHEECWRYHPPCALMKIGVLLDQVECLKENKLWAEKEELRKKVLALEKEMADFIQIKNEIQYDPNMQEYKINFTISTFELRKTQFLPGLIQALGSRIMDEMLKSFMTNTYKPGKGLVC